MRLPSRNWTIFLTVTGSFFATLAYDRRQKKAVQKKWCDLVAHVAQEKLPVNQTARKITVFLSAPPGDGIKPSRDYFRQYIKPVLVAAAIEYDVIEGRREGEVRYGTAEQIRRLRRKRGEKSDKEQVMDVEQAIDLVREKMLINEEPGVKGDLVLGRHTWKEYIRGIHEGWLGPLDEPAIPQPTPPDPLVLSDADAEKQPEDPKPEEAEKKPKTPPAYVSTNSYSLSPLAPTAPSLLEPSEPIYQQHLLGFLKTPQRVYNFLTRRHLADDLGRQTAAIVLAAHRPYKQSENLVSDFTSPDQDPPLATRSAENDALPTSSDTQLTELSVSDPADRAASQRASHCEQQSELTIEEQTWHKSVRAPKKGIDSGTEVERVWLDNIVMDPRIAERMRRFELSPEEETRAERIGRGEEKGLALPVEDLRKLKVTVGELSDEEG